MNNFALEVTRVSHEVGHLGILGGQARVVDVKGTWSDLTEVVNKLAGNLTTQVRSIAKVGSFLLIEFFSGILRGLVSSSFFLLFLRDLVLPFPPLLWLHRVLPPPLPLNHPTHPILILTLTR